jgi:hypothetical protein
MLLVALLAGLCVLAPFVVADTLYQMDVLRAPRRFVVVLAAASLLAILITVETDSLLPLHIVCCGTILVYGAVAVMATDSQRRLDCVYFPLRTILPLCVLAEALSG